MTLWHYAIQYQSLADVIALTSLWHCCIWEIQKNTSSKT